MDHAQASLGRLTKRLDSNQHLPVGARDRNRTCLIHLGKVVLHLSASRASAWRSQVNGPTARRTSFVLEAARTSRTWSVDPRGVEPRSPAFQAGAMAALAQGPKGSCSLKAEYAGVSQQEHEPSRP